MIIKLVVLSALSLGPVLYRDKLGRLINSSTLTVSLSSGKQADEEYDLASDDGQAGSKWAFWRKFGGGGGRRSMDDDVESLSGDEGWRRG